MRNRALRNGASFILLVLVAACALVPRQEVLPFPDHIQAGIEVGDKVEIVKTDGTVIKTTVTDVTNDAIVGTGHRVPFSQIATLIKRSWRPAKNPCDNGAPLGCSIPAVITVLSEYHSELGNKLAPSCITHDFCYRHGLMTYGHDRIACDSIFLQDMRNQCSKEYKLDLIGGAGCRLAAKQMYLAVVRYGEKRFQGSAGSYCEYAGPR